MTHSNILARAPRLCALFAASIAFLSRSTHADLAIEHVTVIPMTRDGSVMTDMTVFIRKDRIESITPSATTKLDRNTPTLSARGHYLMPALADMHVHLENDRLMRLYGGDPSAPRGTVRNADSLLPYVANGVLQITVLSAMPETIAQRDEVELGRVLGPHIALAAMIDGAPPMWPIGMTRTAATASDGRQAVRDAHAEGYEIIKAYEQLDLDTYLAIIDEARHLNMKVIGHLPRRFRDATEQFFVPGLSMIAHAEEYAQQSSIPDVDLIPSYAQWAKRSGTWLTPTLTVDVRIAEMMKAPETLRIRPELRYLNPVLQAMALGRNRYVSESNPKSIAAVERIIAFNRQLVRAFAAEGIPIVAGTDALVPGIVPGFSLHDELALLVEAGLTHKQVLESATRLPAEFLGTLSDRGEIDIGKRANLLLLEADPLQDIANTRRIAGVIVNGRLFSRAELDARMQALRQSATRP